jgi:hypothetical protein
MLHACNCYLSPVGVETALQHPHSTPEMSHDLGHVVSVRTHDGHRTVPTYLCRHVHQAVPRTNYNKLVDN